MGLGLLGWILVGALVVLAALATWAIYGGIQGTGPQPPGNWVAMKPVPVFDTNTQPTETLTPTKTNIFAFDVKELQYNTATASTREEAVTGLELSFAFSDPSKAAFVGTIPTTPDIFGKARVEVKGVDQGEIILTITVTDPRVSPNSTVSGSSRTGTASTLPFNTDRQ